MRLDIFLGAAIAFRGNSFLQGKSGGIPPDLFDAKTLCQSIREVGFHRDTGFPVRRGQLAQGIKPFFAQCEREGVDEFRLTLRQCERGSICSVKGGWGFVATSDHKTELWQPAWKRELARYDESNLFCVRFESMKHSGLQIMPKQTVAELNKVLGSMMQEALQLCIKLDFAPLFDMARRGLADTCDGRIIAAEIVGKTSASDFEEPTRAAVQCISLVEDPKWKRAIVEMDQEGQLARLTHVMWVSALKLLESAVAEAANCPTQKTPILESTSDR